MNFEYFTDLSREYCYEEIKIIGKDAVVSGRRMHLAAMVRKKDRAQLCILVQMQKQPKQRQTDARPEKEVNRDHLHLSYDFGQEELMAIQELRTDEIKLEFVSVCAGRLNVSDLSVVMLFTQLAGAGWKLPKDHPFVTQDWDCLELLRCEFDCPSMRLPEPGDGRWHIRWHMSMRRYPIEKPVVLKIGKGQRQEKKQEEEQAQIAFTIQNRDGVTRQAVCYIYQVVPEDPWEDQDRQFADPAYEKKMLQHMTREEFEQMKRQISASMQELCPRGKYFPVLEYECTLPLQLHFAAKRYLDAPVSQSKTSVSMMIKPESPQLTGAHGLQLKNAVIQEAVAFDTEEIEAELTEAYEIVPEREETLMWL